MMNGCFLAPAWASPDLQSQIDETNLSSELSNAQKTYFCSFDGCAMKFDRPSRLQWHIRNHTGEKPFQCNIGACLKAYATSTKLKRHQKTYHKVNANGNSLEVQSATNAVEGDELRREKYAITGTEATTGESGSEAATGGSALTTGTTGIAGSQSLDTSIYLNNLTSLPMATSNQTPPQVDQHKYKCKEEGCEKTFKRRANLYNHRVVQHEKRANFSCTVEGCSQTFTFPNRLKRHMKSHEGYKCKECSEVFSKWSEVRAHMGAEHMKVHCCTLCSKTFKRPCDLHRHLLTHSAAKERYVCTDADCTKSYDRVSTLRKHIKAQHHRELPHKCDQCTATFPHLVNLNRHIKFHEKQKSCTVKKSYPAKGHRKVSMVSRLIGSAVSSSTEAVTGNLPAVQVYGSVLSNPTDSVSQTIHQTVDSVSQTINLPASSLNQTTAPRQSTAKPSHTNSLPAHVDTQSNDVDSRSLQPHDHIIV